MEYSSSNPTAIEISDGKVVKDYQNTHTNELDYAIDNRFYLKDFKKCDTYNDKNNDITIYHDDNEKLKEIVANWTDYLKENEIDYIYITSADEGTSAIFSQIRNSPVAKAETLYQIEFDGNELLLFPVQ